MRCYDHFSVIIGGLGLFMPGVILLARHAPVLLKLLNLSPMKSAKLLSRRPNLLRFGEIINILLMGLDLRQEGEELSRSDR